MEQASTQLLFMVIIGGLGSIMGSYFGTAFIVVPLVIDNLRSQHGVLVSRLMIMFFSVPIVIFLIVETHRMAGLWPIPH